MFIGRRMTTAQEETVVFDIDWKFEDWTVFDAGAWNEWVCSSLPVFAGLEPKETLEIGDGLRLEMKVLPTQTRQSRFAMDFVGSMQLAWLNIYLGRRRGKIRFDDEALIPVLAEKDGTGWDTWMSITPMEVLSQRTGWKKSKGRTLVAGLGLGFLVRQCLLRDKVEHVHVVEKDPAIAQYFGDPLKEEFGDRLTIEVGDIWEHLDVTIPEHVLPWDFNRLLKQRRKHSWWNNSERLKGEEQLCSWLCLEDVDQMWHVADDYDAVLIDIWKEVSGKCDDERFQSLLEAKHPKVWGWGYAIYDNGRY